MCVRFGACAQVVLSPTRLTHDYTFSHAYYSQNAAYTFVGLGAGKTARADTLDFMYHTNPALRLVQRLQVTAKEGKELNEERARLCKELLPNHDIPSDHLPVLFLLPLPSPHIIEQSVVIADLI